MDTNLNRWMCYRLNRNIEMLAQLFVDEYYTYEDWSVADFYFVWQDDSDNLKYNFFVWDDYYTIEDMFTALWYWIPKDILMEWREQWFGDTNEDKINLKNFYLLKTSQC